MRKFILTIICVVAVCSMQAQLQTGFHYKIKMHKRICKKNYLPPTIYYTIDSAKKTAIPKALCNSKKGLKASVVQDDKDPTMLKVDFWSIKPNDADLKCQKDTNTINSTVLLDDKHFYYLRIDKRTQMCIPIKFISLSYATTEFGVTTIPFKYRFGNKKDSISNDFSSDITGGVYVGRKWGRTRFYQDKLKTTNSLSFTAAIFAAPTVIAISSDNTRRKVQIKSNEMGIGFGGAFLISYRDLNIGILGGFDFPVSGDSYKWIYANKPWIGFGIGYKLAVLNGGKG
ncbi:MAG: hypothetical protein JWP12_1596 [Bacteroidetes bacterium]|nr:hypothetical protein [Bacteroidota bacterium]